MARKVTRRSGAKVRRSTRARRTSIPRARQLSGIGSSFHQLLGALGAASASLEQSRRPMRRR